MKLRVASIQLVSTQDIDFNLARCQQRIAEAADNRVDIVVLPENAFCYGLQAPQVEPRQQEIYKLLGNWAQTHKLWLVAGSLPWLDTHYAPLATASCFVFNPEGKEVLHYRKIHLFDADVKDATGRYRESDHYSPGSKKGVFTTPWGKFGVAICYDLRFPEYFRALMDDGLSVLFIPSAFTWVTGEAHWEILLRARAIENQVFVVAANQGGEHSPARKTWGESMIVDPWGRIVSKAAMGEAIVTAEINLDEVKSLRQQMPVLQHRMF